MDKQMALPDRTLCWVEGPPWDRTIEPATEVVPASELEALKGRLLMFESQGWANVLVRERDEARAELARVSRERDEARAEVERQTRKLFAEQLALKRACEALGVSPDDFPPAYDPVVHPGDPSYPGKAEHGRGDG